MILQSFILTLISDQKKFSAVSDRVKSVDFHPTEPWILASLYNGNVYIWNYKTQNLVKSFEVTDLPGTKEQTTWLLELMHPAQCELASLSLASSG